MNTRLLSFACFPLFAAAVRAEEVEVLFDATHVEAWDTARVFAIH